MDDLELIKIGMFKLSEAAKRLDALAGAARTPKVQRALFAIARALDAHEQQLRLSGNPPTSQSASGGEEPRRTAQVHLVAKERRVAR